MDFIQIYIIYAIYCAFWVSLDIFNIVNSNLLFYAAGSIGTILILLLYLTK